MTVIAEAQPDALREQLARAGARLGAPAEIAPLLERPRDPSHGDWASNYALILAKPLGRKPRDIAADLVKSLDVGAAGVEEGPEDFSLWERDNWVDCA